MATLEVRRRGCCCVALLSTTGGPENSMQSWFSTDVGQAAGVTGPIQCVLGHTILPVCEHLSSLLIYNAAAISLKPCCEVLVVMSLIRLFIAACVCGCESGEVLVSLD